MSVHKQIKIWLTPEEVNVRKAELSTTKSAREELEERLQPDLDCLQSLKTKQKHLEAAVEHHFEYHDMELEERADFEKQVVRFVNPVTGDVHGERPMVDEDYQQNLLDERAKKTAKEPVKPMNEDEARAIAENPEDHDPEQVDAANGLLKLLGKKPKNKKAARAEAV